MTEQFFYKYFPHYATWEHYPAWLKWADAQGFVQRVYQDERKEKLLAAAVARPISDISADVYHFNNQGDIIFIDDLAAENMTALRAVTIAVIRRFGPRKTVAFDSHCRGIRFHDLDKSLRALLKVKNNAAPAAHSPAST